MSNLEGKLAHYHSLSNHMYCSLHPLISPPTSFIHMVAEGAKKSPELIQLLALHTQFATITPYTQVSTNTKYGSICVKTFIISLMPVVQGSLNCMQDENLYSQQVYIRRKMVFMPDEVDYDGHVKYISFAIFSCFFS